MAFNPAELKKYGDQISTWLIGNAGVSKGAMDANGDGQVNTLESLSTVFRTTDYKKLQQLLPALDGTPFKHPLDTRFFSEKITTRIAALKTQVNGALLLLGITPGHPLYCDLFVPVFYESALPQYDDGGLCIGYPKNILTRYPNGDYTKGPELTAKEAFDGCLDNALPYGNCTESTYKIISAIELATDGTCPIDAIATEHHAYASYRGSSFFLGINMDAVGLWAQGWTAAVNPVAMYYDSLTHSTNDRFNNQVAHALEPVMVPDLSLQYNDDGTLKATLSLKDCLTLLDNWVPFVHAHPQSLHPFVMFDKTIKTLPPTAAKAMALAYLERFPNHPYAGLPLFKLELSKAQK